MKMSFSGKKYRRTRCENFDELVRASNANENVIHMLTCNAPTFSFTQLDSSTFNFKLLTDQKVMTHDFRLGEEYHMERRDGSKVKVTYALENDNVLKQTIKQPDGKIAYFRREFGENEAKMTITMEGTNVQATVYYEVVE